MKRLFRGEAHRPCRIRYTGFGVQNEITLFLRRISNDARQDFIQDNADVKQDNNNFANNPKNFVPQHQKIQHIR
ncbi:MAG: hypothetical protein LBJ00_05675 [Planctomycetaceae bacterium]|nr:hypothetical protein [Planctomycetaceae bacterium]